MLGDERCVNIRYLIVRNERKAAIGSDHEDVIAISLLTAKHEAKPNIRGAFQLFERRRELQITHGNAIKWRNNASRAARIVDLKHILAAADGPRVGA